MSKAPDYDYDDHDDNRDCYQCGGEGFVWDCFDGFCVNAEDGCDDCTRPCPECARSKREREKAERDETALKQVLADALSQPTDPNQERDGED